VLARTLSKQNLEKEVTKVIPQSVTSERAKYVSEKRLELKLGVSEELPVKFRRAQDLVSQKTRKNASLEVTLVEILEEFLQKNDPRVKATSNLERKTKGEKKFELVENRKRNFKPGESEKIISENSVPKAAKAEPQVSEPVPGQAVQHNKSIRYIAAKTKHQVHLRDQSQCVFAHSDGKRCESRRWLKIHHQIPLSQNGTNDITNLKMLCTAHHKQQH
jgi:hypothetical protein